MSLSEKHKKQCILVCISMKHPLKIIFTVTNDLNYDQRMIRICSTLVTAGYDVTLVGFKRKNSTPLTMRSFRQVRLPIMVERGKIMYIHYWFRLFCFLFFTKSDVLCAIDLDTIVPVFFASVFRKRKRVYDAHEIFTDIKESISRPVIHKMWTIIANYFIPRFPVGYTIGECYASEFKKRYGVDYKIVRNATVLKPLIIPEKKEQYILYQGAVNVGRCFEQLIPAMKQVETTLIVCGEGNFFNEARAITAECGLQDKVIFKGYVPPTELPAYTNEALVGITLFEETSLSNRLSLANRFFDYMHAAVPQLCVSFPEYERINERFEIACLIRDTTPESIAGALHRLLHDVEYYTRLQQNCLKAREVYNWQQETITLLSVYRSFESQ